MPISTWSRTALSGLSAAVLALAGCHSTPDPVAQALPPTVRARPAGGFFRPPLQVTLTCSSPGGACSDLRYTLDGSEPTATSLPYRAPLQLDATTTLRFTGWDATGQATSGQALFQADGEPPLVSATPGGGLFAADQLVELHCSDGAGAGCTRVRYTLDGSAPGPSAQVYGAPLVVTADSLVRFAAEDVVGNRSGEGAEQYLFDRTGPTTAATPAGGAYRLPVEVALGCADVGAAGCAATHYTLDGAAPSTLSPRYQGPLTLATSATLRFLSVDALDNAGPEFEEHYLVDGAPPVTTATPGPGLYADGVSVHLDCRDAGAGCGPTRYTLDGSDPGPGSPVVGAGLGIAVAASTTVRFASEDLLGNLEPAQQARYEIDARAPVTTAAPAGGTFAGPVDLVLACDDGPGPAASGCASVRYTIDGTPPGPGALPYTGPIHLDASATVAFCGVDRFGHVEPWHAVMLTIDQAPPRVVATAPRDLQAGLPPEATFTITFDEAIAPATLALSGTSGGTSVPGATTLDAASRIATFTPSAPLPAGADVTMTLAAGLADPLGNATPAARAFTFHTRGLPVVLPPAGAATQRARALGANAAGDVVAIFSASTGTATTLRYAVRPAGGDWSDSAQLSATDGSGIKVASDGTGFLVTWVSGTSLVARALRDGQLGPLEVIASAPAARLAVASNGGGYAVAWATTLQGYNGSAWVSYPAISVRIREGDTWLPRVNFGSLTDWADGPTLASAGGGYVLAFMAGTSVQGRTATYNRIRAFTAQGGGAWTGQDAFVDAASPVTAPALASDGVGYGLLFGTVRDVQFGLGAVPAPGVNASFSFLPLEARTGVARVALSAGAAGFGAAWQSVEGTDAVTRGATRSGAGWTSPAEGWRFAGTPAGLFLVGAAPGHLATALVQDAAGATDRRVLPLLPAGWGPPETLGPSAANLVVASAGGSFRLAWDEDDGVMARVLRSRLHDGLLAGPTEDLLKAPLAASASGLRLAANGAGDVMAVWLAQHRGAQALFSSLRRGGVFEPPVLVDFPALAPSVETDGTGFAVGYIRPSDPFISGEAVVRLHDGASFGPPEQLTSAGRAFSILLASDGASWAATFDQGSVGGIQVRIREGGLWGAPVSLTAGGSISSEESLLAWPGAYEIGFADQTPGAGVGRLRRDAAGWVGSPLRLAANAWSSAWRGPSLARGNAGLLASWIQDSSPTVSLDTGNGYGAAQRLSSAYFSSSERLLAAPLGGGFLVVGSCGPVRAWTYDGAWQSLVSEPRASRSTLFALRASSSGPGLLYQDEPTYGALPSLLVSHFLDGEFTSSVPVATGAGSPQLVVDGPGVTAGWTEVDPADPTLTRAVVQGGL